MSSSPFVWRVWRTATVYVAIFEDLLLHPLTPPTPYTALQLLRARGSPCLPSLLLLRSIADFATTQLFPGLIYRMVKPKVVLLIFVSGKIVLTGAKVSFAEPFPPLRR